MRTHTHTRDPKRRRRKGSKANTDTHVLWTCVTMLALEYVHACAVCVCVLVSACSRGETHFIHGFCSCLHCCALALLSPDQHNNTHARTQKTHTLTHDQRYVEYVFTSSAADVRERERSRTCTQPTYMHMDIRWALCVGDVADVVVVVDAVLLCARASLEFGNRLKIARDTQKHTHIH